MIGKDYLSRQAFTLLRFSRMTRDPQLASNLMAKAADLQSRSDEAPLVPELPIPGPTTLPNRVGRP
jgi:hypothetical protein